MNSFIIDAQLPGLNTYIDECRSHWSKGAEMKKNVEELIGWSIMQAKNKKQLFPVPEKAYPVVIHIYWHEKTKRRDVDNIQSAQKFVLDAMQRCGIIKNDSRRYVSQIYHKIIDDEKDFVMVEIKSE